MSTTVAHLKGAARAFPRGTTLAPAPILAPREATPNDSTPVEPTRTGLLAAVGEHLEGFGRWLEAMRYGAAVGSAGSVSDDLALTWLLLGAVPPRARGYGAQPQRSCCRDY